MAKLAIVASDSETLSSLSTDQLIARRDEMVREYQEMPLKIREVELILKSRIRGSRTLLPVRITKKQQIILDYVRAKMCNKDIAQAMNLSVNGVKYHISLLLKHSGCQTRKELML